ncbi:HAD family hydrolase [Williamsoniiplasma somnilux]|uniref:HAD family hydrolase n=1 Tax=Williamsoniiplasma somnilux TaxID=215578 RepID=A0A2K8NYV7_9MOLU|nr:Cof-type HAD-IIB family hydrolase [Williamsoniiplasma somnilux]ATZ19010.1 HAD family hydrolase [Williamsoniiplasma somnilux]
MLKNIRLVVTDLDGTVLEHGKIANHNDLDTLLKLEKKGIALTIATGQNWSNAVTKAHIFEIQNGVDYIICNNGAYISKVSKYEPICVIKIENNLVQKVYNKCTEMNITFFAYYKENRHMYWNGVPLTCESLNARNWTDKFILNDISQIENFDYDSVFQIMIFVPDQEVNSFEQWFKEEGLDQELLSMSNNIESMPIYEFTNIKTNKGVAVRNLAKLLKIDLNDVITFGDNLNDMEMIKDMPHSVAVGNAVPKIKEAATYITDTNKNGGVSKFINEHILGGK